MCLGCPLQKQKPFIFNTTHLMNDYLQKSWKIAKKAAQGIGALLKNKTPLSFPFPNEKIYSKKFNRSEFVLP